MIKNYYGDLCTEMYEILHKDAPEDELEFYLSYAEKGMKILEPLCGSGRFLVPFHKKGVNITGMDLSMEMLAKLCEKAPDAKVFQGDILEYDSEERYDYIFISSGSVSLFTDMKLLRKVLKKIKTLLKKGGIFVFAVDTIVNRCQECAEYKNSISVKTKEGFELLLKEKHYYNKETHIQYSPGIYELYDGVKLLKRESMDFQTRLYELGEMEHELQALGFSEINVYSSYERTIAENNSTEMFLYECSF